MINSHKRLICKECWWQLLQQQRETAVTISTFRGLLSCHFDVVCQGGGRAVKIRPQCQLCCGLYFWRLSILEILGDDIRILVIRLIKVWLEREYLFVFDLPYRGYWFLLQVKTSKDVMCTIGPRFGNLRPKSALRKLLVTFKSLRFSKLGFFLRMAQVKYLDQRVTFSEFLTTSQGKVIGASTDHRTEFGWCHCDNPLKPKLFKLTLLKL